MALIKLNNQSLSAVTSAGLPSGTVLQVKSVSSNTHQTINQTSYTDITGMSVSITPTSTSSKILVIASVSASKDNAHSGLVQLVRGSTAIGGGSGSGSHLNNVMFNIRDSSQYYVPSHSQSYLDSPSTTSATTYKLQGKTTQASNPLYVNRTRNNNTTQEYDSPVATTLTVMEIAG